MMGDAIRVAVDGHDSEVIPLPADLHELRALARRKEKHASAGRRLTAMVGTVDLSGLLVSLRHGACGLPLTRIGKRELQAAAESLGAGAFATGIGGYR